MTRKTFADLTRVALFLACAGLLSGCQWFGGGRASLRSSEMARHIPEDFGSDQLAAGRAALSQGRVSEAIDSFMVARLYPEHAAAAHNGLAVAYSQIGRSDLAERFFRTAIALAPADERFRSNLALFYERNGVSRTAGHDAVKLIQTSRLPASIAPDEDAAAASSEPSRVAEIARAGGVTVQASGSRLRRVSARESIVVERAGRAEARQVALSSPARARIVAARQAYPIRIKLPASSSPISVSARPVASSAAGYPVRITLPVARRSSSRMVGERPARSTRVEG